MKRIIILVALLIVGSVTYGQNLMIEYNKLLNERFEKVNKDYEYKRERQQEYEQSKVKFSPHPPRNNSSNILYVRHDPINSITEVHTSTERKLTIQSQYSMSTTVKCDYDKEWWKLLKQTYDYRH